jgi:hypothetical protein
MSEKFDLSHYEGNTIEDAWQQIADENMRGRK